MKTFKDSQGREWQVTVNVTTIKRVRDLVKVDLLEVLEGKLLERLASDPILLVDVLYVVCKPQADKDNVTDESFGAALAGKSIEDATTAFLEELVDFFPEPRKGLLQKALQKMTSFYKMATTMAGEKFDSKELEQELQQQIATALSTKSPASSA